MATLGETLYAARSAREETLEDVARVLRIRPAILQALETGETSSLPTGAVTKGFVRSYTKYLGLDDDQAVRLFEEETGLMTGKSSLNFPEIVEPARLPGLGTVIAGLVLFALAVASWFTYSNRDALGLERVSELPDHLVKLIRGEQDIPDETTSLPSQDTDQPETAAIIPTAPMSSAAEGVEDTSLPGENSLPTQPGAAEEDTLPSLPETTTSTPPSTPELSGPVIVAVLPPLNAEPSDTDDQSTPEQSLLPDGEQPAIDRGENQTDVIVPEVKITSTEAGNGSAIFTGEGAIYGDTEGVPRVVVRALGDSWVQVRNEAGRTVFSRILRTGDIYRVPKGDGLNMIAGSVGDLQFWVDGAPLSPLGDKGRVRRDIPLNAERLKTIGPG